MLFLTVFISVNNSVMTGLHCVVMALICGWSLLIDFTSPALSLGPVCCIKDNVKEQFHKREVRPVFWSIRGLTRALHLTQIQTQNLRES